MSGIINQTKYCPSCKIDKDYSLFSKNKNKYDGLQSTCKICIKEYRSSNKELHRANQRDYAIRNKNKIAIKNKAYFLTEIGKEISRNSRYMRRSIFRSGDVTANQLIELKANHSNCYWCKEPLYNKIVHIDHYIPLSKGGSHTLSNLVVSCSKCNLSKGAKDPLEFAKAYDKYVIENSLEHTTNGLLDEWYRGSNTAVRTKLSDEYYEES